MFLFFFPFARFRLCSSHFLYPVITSTIAFIDLPITVLSPAAMASPFLGYLPFRFVSFPVGLVAGREKGTKRKKYS